MVIRFKGTFLVLIAIAFAAGPVFAQTHIAKVDTNAMKYLDPAAGLTADEAVALALENNGDILAMRKEVDAGQAMVKQAGLRANPKAEFSGTKQIAGPDNSQMAEVMLPLELFGRRAARVAVAKRELEARQWELANQERLLAAEVRLKFGEALAAIHKLHVTEATLDVAKQGYALVDARVTEGKIAPLERNIFLVEVNRLQSARETAEGKVEIALLELRNMIGKRPDEPLRLKGDLADLSPAFLAVEDASEEALRLRPDLEGARSLELVASARIERAKSEGRIDVAVKGGYQRMNSSFMLNGYDDMGMLRPIQDVFHFFTFGVEVDLPVFDRKQGEVAAAAAEREAARRRIEFGELTIRREVAAALARYNRAARAQSIYENGVLDQANANLQVVWQMYELGARSLLDYINEERQCLEFENEVIDAQLETYSAAVELLKAINAPQLKKK